MQVVGKIYMNRVRSEKTPLRSPNLKLYRTDKEIAVILPFRHFFVSKVKSKGRYFKFAKNRNFNLWCLLTLQPKTHRNGTFLLEMLTRRS